MSSSHLRISDLLQDPQSLLGKLINQAKALEALNSSFFHLLDPALSPYCKVGHYQAGILTLFVKNGSFATQIRYQIPDILSQLRKIPTWAGLCSIQVKVATHWPAPEAVQVVSVKREFLKIPKESSDLFEQLAKSLANEPDAKELINSLINLTKHQ